MDTADWLEKLAEPVQHIQQLKLFIARDSELTTSWVSVLGGACTTSELYSF